MNLPKELLCIIAEFCDRRDRAKLVLIDRRVGQIPRLWKSLTIYDNDPPLEWFVKNVDCLKTSLQFLTTSNYISTHFFPNLKKQVIHGDKIHVQLGNVETIKLDSFSYVTVDMRKPQRNIKSLSITAFSIRCHFSPNYLPGLTSLTITNCTLDRTLMSKISKFLRLEKLVLNCNRIFGESESELDWSMAPTLKHVIMQSIKSGIICLSWFEKCPLLEILKISGKDVSSQLRPFLFNARVVNLPSVKSFTLETRNGIHTLPRINIPSVNKVCIDGVFYSSLAECLRAYY